MKKQEQPRPVKLTDAERYRRFLDVANKVEASDDRNDLDWAVKKVAKPQSKKLTTRRP